MSTTDTRERSTAKLWRGLVGWPFAVMAVAGVVAYFDPMGWGGGVLAAAIMGAFIAVPVGLVGLAITSDSATERIVSGIFAAMVIFVDAVLILFVLAMSTV
jgi:hypothetical protein